MDHFLDVFHESKVYRLPSTFILNEILVGTVTVDGKTNQIVDHILIIFEYIYTSKNRNTDILINF